LPKSPSFATAVAGAIKLPRSSSVKLEIARAQRERQSRQTGPGLKSTSASPASSLRSADRRAGEKLETRSF
jgi:hypothetical protein